MGKLYGDTTHESGKRQKLQEKTKLFRNLFVFCVDGSNMNGVRKKLSFELLIRQTTKEQKIKNFMIQKKKRRKF